MSAEIIQAIHDVLMKNEIKDEDAIMLLLSIADNMRADLYGVIE
tara:strand:+ start:204 stop:335 length:132 start_codon:yes stop_codon:yes gene_type:complete